MTKQTTFNFWSAFGKFALLITFLWTGAQIYNWYTDDNGFDISVTGNHSKYRLPPDQREFIDNYKNLILLDKAYREEINSKGLSINKLLNFSKKTTNSDFLENYEFNKKYDPPFKLPEYNNSWEFQIENNGKKPLEQLILEAPFKGIYKISIDGKTDTFGNFDKNIELPDLFPGYSIGVRIWINEIGDYNIFDEEKTRITHKYGFESISYPKEVSGFLKWLTSYNNLPLQLGVVGLVMLFFLTFVAGLNYYPTYAEIERKRKIEEFKKNEELKEIYEEELKAEELRNKTDETESESEK